MVQKEKKRVYCTTTRSDFTFNSRWSLTNPCIDVYYYNLCMCSPEDAVRDITVQCRHHRGRFLLHGQFAFAERTMGNTIDQIGVRLVCKCERRHTQTRNISISDCRTCALVHFEESTRQVYTVTHAHTHTRNSCLLAKLAATEKWKCGSFSHSINCTCACV